MAPNTAHVLIDGPGFASVPLELREGITTLGRLPANDVVLNDHQVSRHHARISFIEGRATFQDLDSHNGSVINDRQVQTKVLEFDDVIRIGPYRLLFRGGRAEATPETLPPVSRHGGITREPRVEGDRRLTSLLLRAIDAAMASEPQGCLPRTLSAIEQSMHTQRCAIIRLRPDGRMTYAAGREDGHPSDRPEIHRPIIEWTIHRRFPVASEDPKNDPRFSNLSSRMPVACVPIGDDRRVWGALYAERTTPTFSLNDLDVLQAVAHVLSAFLERRQSQLPPWSSGQTDDGPRQLAGTVLAVEHLADPTIADTVPDQTQDGAWSLEFVQTVVDEAHRHGALWLGHRERQLLLAFPDDGAPSRPEQALLRRLASMEQQTRVRIRGGLAWGPLFVQELHLPGATRLTGWGEAVTQALHHLERASWGSIRTAGERTRSLEAAGFVADPSGDGALARLESLASL